MLDYDLPIIGIVVIYVILLAKKIRQKSSVKHIVLFTLFYAYIFAVLCITLLPMPINQQLIKDSLTEGNPPHNVIPFSTIGTYFSDSDDSTLTFLKQVGGNIIMFIPFGFYLPFVYCRLTKIKQIFVLGILFSICIEITQFTLSSVIGYNYRTFDVDDLILNTTGAVIGYILIKGCYSLITPIIGHTENKTPY